MTWNRFLVDGAGGFIGASLVRGLLAQGGEVTVFVRENTDPWRLHDVLPKLRVVCGDVADPRAAARALAEARPDVVYHLAAHGGTETQKDGETILRTNVLGTWTMLSACLSSPCRLFVHAGSSSEYGYSREPMRETDRLEPNSLYAVGKAAGTHLCSLLAKDAPFSIVSCRLFSVYGPWEAATRLVPTILLRCRENMPLEMVSRTTARDFVFVDDVVRAFLRWDELDGLSGEVLNLGSGRQTTMEDFVTAALEVTGSRSEVRWGAMKARVWDARTWEADCGKARRLLGWQASSSLRQGLGRTWEWMRSSRRDAP
jgi:nucleoside-diphosphate-sugar epimerase